MSNNTLRKRKHSESTESNLNRADLLQCLEEQESLCDLHAHLLGMGDASFWIHRILTNRKILPNNDDFIKVTESSNAIRLRLGPLVWDETNRGFLDREITRDFFDHLRGIQDPKSRLYESEAYAKLKQLICKNFEDELNHRKLSFQNDFSYDVIFSLENLSKGLGLRTSQQRDMTQALIEENLGISTKDSKENSFKNWIIFNARKQELQIVYGIQAEYLRKLIGEAKPSEELTDPQQRDARAHIINAFSMMNADGSEPRSIDFHSFRGAFTPEFYPRRFALKDSLYEQRLDLLAYLLKHVLLRYLTCSPPVKYCEFSIGCGDLSRPWVFEVLSTFSEFALCLKGKFRWLIERNHFPWLKNDKFKERITYRFLAGFNRQISTINSSYSAEEAITFLYELPTYAIHAMFKEFYLSDNEKPTIIFSQQVNQLKKLKEQADNNEQFFSLVVGLDSCSDELGHPYCPFLAYEFIEFVKDARQYSNENFGLRIHAAENVPFIRPELHGYRLFVVHMYILYRCIDFLKQKLTSGIRIGHGIAFDKLLSIKNYSYRKSSVLTAEMRQSARAVFSSIPFEVNITSNFYLLGNAIRHGSQHQPLSELHKNKVPVILSTDNDGVLPINKCSFNHHSHHSLAAEYCRAISNGFIINRERLEEMITASKSNRFAIDKSLENIDVEKQKDESRLMKKPMTDSTITTKKNTMTEDNTTAEQPTSSPESKDYYPVDVIVHPMVLRELLKKEQNEIITQASCPCLYYYIESYKRMPQSDEQENNTEPLSEDEDNNTESLFEEDYNTEPLSEDEDNNMESLYEEDNNTEPLSEEEDNSRESSKLGKYILPVVVACYYLTRSLCYESFEIEYQALFNNDLSMNNLCKKIYTACENVYFQLMNDATGPYVSMKVTVENKDYWFCSEIPHNRSRESNILLKSIDMLITRDTRNTTVFGFVPSINLKSNNVVALLRSIDDKIEEENEVKIFVYTNTGKDSTFIANKSKSLFINPKPRERTDLNEDKIECILYAVCPHGSVASAALHFIANHISDDFDIHLAEPHLRTLIIPFLPLRFGYPTKLKTNEYATKKKLLKHLSIKSKKLAKKIKVQQYPICRPIYDEKFNLLFSDVKYAKQVEITHLIDLKEFACLSINQRLNILKALYNSIINFHLKPKTFVLLDTVDDYDSYKNQKDFKKISVPIILLSEKFLICTRVEFFKPKSEAPAGILWSLAVSLNSSRDTENNPYEEPHRKWVELIVSSKMDKLNDIFGENTWEHFLAKVLFDASDREWYWHTVSQWCDVIVSAFHQDTDKKVEAFVNFLNNENKAQAFIDLLDDQDRHKLGNRWQRKVIKKSLANTYLQEIRDLIRRAEDND